MNMNSHLWVFILSLITCTGSVSAQLQININATVGSSAVLPCDWSNVTKAQSSNQSPYVQWRKVSETVFERQGEKRYQGEGYENRVDVPEDQLLKGNCSLVLKNITDEDAGVYVSYIVVKRSKRALQPKRVFLQSVELFIAKQEMPNKPSSELLTPETPNNESSDSRSHTGVIITVCVIVVFVLVILTLGLLGKFKARSTFANEARGRYSSPPSD